jgi:homoserine dehydrogenase
MTTCVASSVDVALLGCGNVGTAFARLAAHPSAHPPVHIATALVRDAGRRRPLASSTRVTNEARRVFEDPASILVELLGGVEPARTLLLEALDRRIAVVTANKSLLARCGAELRAAATATSTPLLYEAAVIAGVPFLGAFARRPHAARVSGLVGIANGTSNYVLGRAATNVTIADALREAQRHGYAEPDPHADVAGIDAAEKLAVLVQHFASRDVHPDRFEIGGITSISSHQLRHAAELSGVIKPVVSADWTSGSIAAFAGAAFVPDEHPLARVDGVDNALLLTTPHGRLLFQGPGAGPEVTAATVLDDVREVIAGVAPTCRPSLAPAHVETPETDWLITLVASRLPRTIDLSDLVASHGLFARRWTARHTSEGQEAQSFLTWRATRAQVDLALDAVRRSSGCDIAALRALEVPA